MNVLQTKPQMQTVAFVGNPNSGKTTLFNHLTKSNQKTGNFCGVTVDWVLAECTLESEKIQVVDLPGIYTLAHVEHDENESNEDEKITRRFLEEGRFDVIVNIVDASNLERNLYLTLQCLELGLPMIVAITRMDLAQKKNIQISLYQLQKSLGCPVVAVSCKTGAGIEELKSLLFSNIEPPKFQFRFPALLEQKIQHCCAETHNTLARYQIIRWLEGDTEASKQVAAQNPALLENKQEPAANDAEFDILIATARYNYIENLLAQVILPYSKLLNAQTAKPSKATQWIDYWVCHQWFGLPCFFAIMYALFFFAINIGGAFQDCVEQLTELAFVHALGDLLHHIGIPNGVVLFLQSLGQGLTTVLTFIPVIGAMFFALAFLESSGYMSRAAIVMDRVMLMLGLPGKSFVPMIIGFGCNVPAILGTRALDSKRDRILTVMMSPFMSCGARLAIFTVFVSIFFPHHGQNIVFGLYLIGICMAVLTGLILKKTILSGSVSPLIMEMPEYTLPSLRSLLRLSTLRLKRFIVNALKLIVPVCGVIGLLNAVQVPAPENTTELEPQTVLSVMAKQVTPLFTPMGITQDNWPATVGLFTGILAKEVVIGSLNALYAQPSSVALDPIVYTDALKEAAWSIPENLLTLRGALQNPIAAKAPVETVDLQTHIEMQQRFGTREAAFAYLLFVLLYFPCISATAAMVKEVKKGWTLFSVCWTTGLAYCIAVCYFQLSTWALHPQSSFAWCAGIAALFAVTLYVIHSIGKQKLGRALPTQIVFLKPDLSKNTG